MAKQPDRPNRGGRRRWWAALTGAVTYWLWRRWRSGGKKPSASAGPSSSAVPQHSLEQGHEGETTSVTGVLVAVALIVGLVAVTVWGVVEFAGLLGREGRAPVSELRITDAGAVAADRVPPPRLQLDPALDLQELHRYEHERLYTYGRIDSARLHIPIGRAMQLVARRGLPADTATSADTLLVPTESGFRVFTRRFPAAPQVPPYLGSSPEPYTPRPTFLRYLTEEGYLPRADSASPVVR